MELTIKGFRNQEEINEFMSWYWGQGEQDFSIWLECRVDEGLPVRDFIGVVKADEINNILFLEE